MKTVLDKNITGNSNWLETERKRERRMNLFGEKDSARFAQFEHADQCDAQQLRDEHEEFCDAEELRTLHSKHCEVMDDYTEAAHTESENEDEPVYDESFDSNRTKDYNRTLLFVTIFVFMIVLLNIILTIF